MRCGLVSVPLLALACGSGTTHLDPRLPDSLAAAPLVLVVLESGGVTDWQKERDQEIPDRLTTCLPQALAPVCPAQCEVREASGEETAGRVVLTVRTEYLASAHFMHGYRIEVEYVMEDGASKEKLAGFRYVDEPLSKVMAEEGSDMDEVLTAATALTAERFCEDVVNEAAAMPRTAD